MNYNFKEKQAIISVVMAMAQADGIIDPNELAYFEQLQELLRITPAELRSVTATVDNDFSLLGLIVLSQMDEQKKADVKKMLLQMMTSDSDLNEKELTLFNFICRVTGMDNAPDSIEGNSDLDYDPARIIDSKAAKALASAEKRLLGEGKN
ncbi:MAG: TerB family tellurite resistance protein [Bacteroidales bacterium]|nr:TerB family tellurite resistance protein [Bacteroidales bacterium]